MVTPQNSLPDKQSVTGKNLPVTDIFQSIFTVTVPISVLSAVSFESLPERTN